MATASRMWASRMWASSVSFFTPFISSSGSVPSFTVRAGFFSST